MHDDEIKSLRAGPYELVARWHDGHWAAAVWGGGKKLFHERAESLAAAWQLTLDWVAERAAEIAERRGGGAPSAAEARKAFYAIDKRMTSAQRKMLKAHLDASDHVITATGLASAAGFKSYRGANLQYGFLGAMLVGEMPENLPQRPDGSRIATCAIASVDDIRESVEDEWLWKMRPHIVEGLRSSILA